MVTSSFFFSRGLDLNGGIPRKNKVVRAIPMFCKRETIKVVNH